MPVTRRTEATPASYESITADLPAETLQLSGASVMMHGPLRDPELCIVGKVVVSIDPFGCVQISVTRLQEEVKGGPVTENLGMIRVGHHEEAERVVELLRKALDRFPKLQAARQAVGTAQ